MSCEKMNKTVLVEVRLSNFRFQITFSVINQLIMDESYTSIHKYLSFYHQAWRCCQRLLDSSLYDR